MEQATLRRLLQRYQQGECTPAELQAVEAWYESLGEDREALSLPAAEQDAVGAALWQGINARIAEASQPVQPMQPVMRASRWKQWAAAAAIVISGGVGAWVLRPQLHPLAPAQPVAMTAADWVTQRNTTSQSVRIQLVDGSVVRLAPASQLRYPRQFPASRRSVELVGEAFFQVAHNPAKPFRVYTDKVVTTVLGTSFTVRAFAGQAQAQVLVRTGRVRVTPRTAADALDKPAAAATASVLLLPNQQVVYSPAAPALEKELVAQPEVLVDQSFSFDDRPVAEVLTALEKAYGVAIDYDRTALAGCTVTLTLRDPTLYGKLDVLCKTLGASYEVVGTRIRLHAKGCTKG